MTKATAKLLGSDFGFVFTSRDEAILREEETGRIEFKVIHNNGTLQNLEWLTGLKNIFTAQLPKMPKEYICHLVFDRKHRSMVILRAGQVVGGICYRPAYPENYPSFAEIAFLAIKGVEQVKGFGTRLMNHLKEYARSQGIYHFMTYADNYAIGYFRKQGFTKGVTLERDNWFGIIKDYDGGTLMECSIHPKISYSKIPHMIRKQRECVLEKVKEISRSHIVYPGLKEFETQASVKPESIPGLREAGWDPSQPTANDADGSEEDSLQETLRDLLTAIRKHGSAWPFHEAVDENEVPDYYQVIKDPIDLTTMESRLGNGYYKSKDMFIADLKRMCANAKKYNAQDTIYYRCAVNVEQFIAAKLDSLFPE